MCFIINKSQVSISSLFVIKLQNCSSLPFSKDSFLIEQESLVLCSRLIRLEISNIIITYNGLTEKTELEEMKIILSVPKADVERKRSRDHFQIHLDYLG